MRERIRFSFAYFCFLDWTEDRNGMEKVKLILASESVTRRKLLENAGLVFESLPAHIDEEEIKRSLVAAKAHPQEVATFLAERKACKISQKHPECIVIGGDQVLELNGTILSKPKTKDQAREQLLNLRNSSHNLISSVCVAEGGQRVWHQTDKASIQLSDFTDQFLEHYLVRSEKELFNGPGGYKVEGYGIHLIDRIEGDFFTVLGLPIILLLKYFRTRGLITL